MQKSRHEIAVFIAMLAAICGCASGTWFSAGPRPPEIAGIWIDAGLTTYSDSVAWNLAANGEFATMHISVNRDARGVTSTATREVRNGMWFLSGRLNDAANRAICYKRRVRDGATCLHFELDTIGIQPLRRRLTVLGLRNQPVLSKRIFVERTR